MVANGLNMVHGNEEAVAVPHAYRKENETSREKGDVEAPRVFLEETLVHLMYHRA